jgi:hypothetical protein
MPWSATQKPQSSTSFPARIDASRPQRLPRGCDNVAGKFLTAETFGVGQTIVFRRLSSGRAAGGAPLLRRPPQRGRKRPWSAAQNPQVSTRFPARIHAARLQRLPRGYDNLAGTSLAAETSGVGQTIVFRRLSSGRADRKRPWSAAQNPQVSTRFPASIDAALVARGACPCGSQPPPNGCEPRAQASGALLWPAEVL